MRYGTISGAWHGDPLTPEARATIVTLGQWLVPAYACGCQPVAQIFEVDRDWTIRGERFGLRLEVYLADRSVRACPDPTAHVPEPATAVARHLEGVLGQAVEGPFLAYKHGRMAPDRANPDYMYWDRPPGPLGGGVTTMRATGVDENGNEATITPVTTPTPAPTPLPPPQPLGACAAYGVAPMRATHEAAVAELIREHDRRILATLGVPPEVIDPRRHDYEAERRAALIEEASEQYRVAANRLAALVYAQEAPGYTPEALAALAPRLLEPAIRRLLVAQAAEVLGTTDAERRQLVMFIDRVTDTAAYRRLLQVLLEQENHPRPPGAHYPTQMLDDFRAMQQALLHPPRFAYAYVGFDGPQLADHGLFHWDTGQAAREVREGLLQQRTHQPAPPVSGPMQRAKELLLRHLSDEQRAQFARDSSFVVTAASGHRYRLRGSGHKSFNVDLLKGKSSVRVAATLCVVLKGKEAPIFDQMLAQKLLIETNERQFIDTANWN